MHSEVHCCCLVSAVSAACISHAVSIHRLANSSSSSSSQPQYDVMVVIYRITSRSCGTVCLQEDIPVDSQGAMDCWS